MRGPNPHPTGPGPLVRGRPGRRGRKIHLPPPLPAERAGGHCLETAGVRRGDRVLVMLPRVWQWWAAMLGLIRLGAVPVPATLQLMPRDVAYRLKTARIRAVLTNAEGLAKVGGFDRPPLWPPARRPPAGWISTRRLRRRRPHFAGAPTRATIRASFTSPAPPPASPRWSCTPRPATASATALTGEFWLDCRPGEVHWNISDLGWGKAAWSSFFGPWHMGACVFAVDIHGKFDPPQTLDILARLPHHHLVRPAHRPAPDRAAGSLHMDIPAPAPLRHRRRTPQSRNHQTLEDRHRPGPP